MRSGAARMLLFCSLGAGLLMAGAAARLRALPQPAAGSAQQVPPRVAEQLGRLAALQGEQRKLLEELAVAAGQEDRPVCMDKNDACPTWVPCCPGGDGVGASCGPADCSAPGKPGHLCEGLFTRDNCQVTCGTCPAGSRPVERPAPPTPAPPPGRLPELLAIWEELGVNKGPIDGMDGARWRCIHENKPRALTLTGVVSPEEAKSLIEISRPDMRPSTVVHPGNQSEGRDSVRTSSGMWLTSPEQLAHPARAKLVRAMSRATHVPEQHFEQIQILHYEPGQYYVHHGDWFEPHMKDQLSRGGQRIATGILFLNTVPEGGGGETKLVWARPEPITVRPIVGNALIFYDVDRKWRGDRYSEHEAIPPKPGNEKWVAITWMREGSFSL
eukprot:TRINITY_DN55682_c0_g1_i1.p1 TRINITY_DN55682_c0_g1~~TRINITY_DN55682_c0_g1_i1.p1  ORF type:complete len:385 (+),score=58.73 TRINITY_DN55682_c0_g1_i1:78-1232(+)